MWLILALHITFKIFTGQADFDQAARVFERNVVNLSGEFIFKLGFYLNVKIQMVREPMNSNLIMKCSCLIPSIVRKDMTLMLGSEVNLYIWLSHWNQQTVQVIIQSILVLVLSNSFRLVEVIC